MEKTVNELSSGLDFVLITIFLIKEDKLYSQAYTKSIFTEVINNILPQPVDLIHVSLKNHTDNIVVRSVNEQKILYTNNLFDIGKYAVPKFLVDLSVKLTGFKCAIVMPLIDPQNKSIGAIFFAKNRNESFDNELPILKSFVEYLTTIIINAQKYEELKNELSKLKSTNSQVV